MSTRETAPPPVYCDVCGAEITEVKPDGCLDCEVIDLHDGTPVLDVCRPCTSKPLTVICKHIADRKGGHPMRKVAEPAKPLTEPVELEAGDQEGEEEEEIPPEKLAEKQK